MSPSAFEYLHKETMRPIAVQRRCRYSNWNHDRDFRERKKSEEASRLVPLCTRPQDRFLAPFMSSRHMLHSIRTHRLMDLRMLAVSE
jgi:hypothetical protein